VLSLLCWIEGVGTWEREVCICNQLISVLTTLEKTQDQLSSERIKTFKTKVVPEMNNINELKSRYNQIYPAFGSYTGNLKEAFLFFFVLQKYLSLQSVCPELYSLVFHLRYWVIQKSK
jgi:hypothetical protein